MVSLQTKSLLKVTTKKNCLLQFAGEILKPNYNSLDLVEVELVDDGANEGPRQNSSQLFLVRILLLMFLVFIAVVYIGFVFLFVIFDDAANEEPRQNSSQLFLVTFHCCCTISLPSVIVAVVCFHCGCCCCCLLWLLIMRQINIDSVLCLFYSDC